MRPKLLLISRKWPPAIGGMETYSVELDASLAMHFEVTRKVLPGKANGRPPGLFAYAFFLLKTALYCLLYAHRFSHVVLGDLVLFPAALCCRLRTSHQKRLVVVYGLDLVYFRRKGLLPRVYGLYFGAFRTLQNRFSGIVAISNFTATLAREAGLKNISVINPSLPKTALTESITKSKASVPEEFYRKGPRKILQFGRLIPRKGAAWFAANVMPLLDNDVNFFVVGASYDDALLESLRHSPRTTYLGSQPAAALAAMIREADIVVMPNITSEDRHADIEGFGLVAIETTSLGGILLAARLQGLSDAVVDNVTGILVEPNDEKAWAFTIRALLSESPERIEQRRAVAVAHTRVRYSKENMANTLRALFESPVGDKYEQ